MLFMTCLRLKKHKRKKKACIDMPELVINLTFFLLLSTAAEVCILYYYTYVYTIRVEQSLLVAPISTRGH